MDVKMMMMMMMMMIEITPVLPAASRQEGDQVLGLSLGCRAA
jgi:hypothetical protein